ncbi:MAG: phosphoribosylformylglycinamidine synthase subunit PurQ [Desulfobacterales bacterium]
MKTVRTLVLTGYGLNCDHETAYAAELAGSAATRVHINSLIDASIRLADFQILVFVGGFSWGDDHGAGVIQAVRMKTHLGDQLSEFIANGNLILGVCNGFQTLVNIGLLPGFDHDYQRRSVALTVNDIGNFRNDWVGLKVNASSPCVFTRHMSFLELPARHGEGKFVGSDETVQRLFSQQQVVLQYATADGTPANGRFPENPNGSVFDIAGICDPTGRVFGLMPHPEAYNHFTNHPYWTRQRDVSERSGKRPEKDLTPGIRMFKNGVDYIRSQV